MSPTMDGVTFSVSFPTEPAWANLSARAQTPRSSITATTSAHRSGRSPGVAASKKNVRNSSPNDFSSPVSDDCNPNKARTDGSARRSSTAVDSDMALAYPNLGGSSSAVGSARAELPDSVSIAPSLSTTKSCCDDCRRSLLESLTSSTPFTCANVALVTHPSRSIQVWPNSETAPEGKRAIPAASVSSSSVSSASETSASVSCVSPLKTRSPLTFVSVAFSACLAFSSAASARATAAASPAALAISAAIVAALSAAATVFSFAASPAFSESPSPSNSSSAVSFVSPPPCSPKTIAAAAGITREICPSENVPIWFPAFVAFSVPSPKTLK
mmetsp:Transcript_4695/g.17364  ORF Transcript_4695/g.17364 Transcript_4695/m.17364 type:complete len:329 (+) Transcript_4695:1413-2399(+)